MTNELKVLNIDGVNCYEENGIAYLNLKDVAFGLGITKTDHVNGSEYVRLHKTNLQKWLHSFGLSKSEKEELPEYIPENIFYRLAMKAKNEVAEKFQVKVADEIIPSIRKNGGYIANQENMTPEQIVANALIVANRIIAERDKQIIEMSNKISELQPKATYYDEILASKDTVLTTQIAKDYGMSAKTFNILLHDLGVQYKVGDQWVLYSKYQGMGYVHSKTHSYPKNDGSYGTRMQTEWRQSGRLFLYDLLKQHGTLPLIERGN